MIYNYGKDVATFTVKFRERSEYTQEQLAKRLGYGPQYVSNIERGRAPRPIGFCVRLMKLLNQKEQSFLYELVGEALFTDVEKKIKKGTQKKIK